MALDLPVIGQESMSESIDQINTALAIIKAALEGTETDVTEIDVTDTPYDIPEGVRYISASGFSGAVTLNLPASAGAGRRITISKPDSSSNAISIVPDGTEKINFASSIVLSTTAATVTLIDVGTAGNEWEIENAHGVTFGTHTFSGAVIVGAAAQAITAVGNTIGATYGALQLNPDADYTLTSTPSIANGTLGQILIIGAAAGEANYVRIQDQGTLASSGVRLRAAYREIKGNAILAVQFDGTDWIEIAFNPGPMREPRCLHVNTTANGNVGTGNDVLMSYAIPAGLLSVNGDRVIIRAAGTLGATADGKFVYFVYGGGGVNSNELAYNGGTWALHAEIIRTGATSQRVHGWIHMMDSTGGNQETFNGVYAGSATLSGATTLQVEGEGVSNDDVICNSLTVDFIPAPAG